MLQNHHIQTEVDASFLYKTLSEREKNPEVADIFSEMGEIETSHAKSFAKKNKLENLPLPSLRAKLIVLLSKYL